MLLRLGNHSIRALGYGVASVDEQIDEGDTQAFPIGVHGPQRCLHNEVERALLGLMPARLRRTRDTAR